VDIEQDCGMIESNTNDLDSFFDDGVTTEISESAAMTPVAVDQASGKNWQMFLGDSCEVIKGIPDNSVDLCIHSPPFSQLYLYSASEADMGNCQNDEEFFQHYSYLIPELYRITVPGRLCVVHSKDLPNYISRDGCSGLRDFPGAITRAFEAAGWSYHSRVTIWKCPVIERARTQSYGLLHAQVSRDSSASRQGMPDYLTVYRKWDGKTPDEFTKPVRGPGANSDSRLAYRFQSYEGSLPPGSNLRFEFVERPITEGPEAGQLERLEMIVTQSGQVEFSQRDYSIQVWQRYASPVWFDIQQTDVLNAKEARDQSDEKHICPLQMGIVRRCVHLWSNPGDVVFSPFAGIGSELVGALQKGRKGLGIELKDGYFETTCKNLRSEENSTRQLNLY
jgi:DNA modification methylase